MTEAARGHPPNLQARLAEVATRLDTGDFTPADIRTLAAAADDVRGVRARVEDALDTSCSAAGGCFGRYHAGAVTVPGAAGGADGAAGGAAASGAFERRHWITIGIIGALLSGVIFFDVDVGLGAFGCAVVLALLKAGDENEAIRLMPWRVMMMVCGVTVLVSVLDRTGGLELFTRVLAGVSTANTVTAFDGRCIPADHAGNRTEPLRGDPGRGRTDSPAVRPATGSP